LHTKDLGSLLLVVWIILNLVLSWLVLNECSIWLLLNLLTCSNLACSIWVNNLILSSLRTHWLWLNWNDLISCLIQVHNLLLLLRTTRDSCYILNLLTANISQYCLVVCTSLSNDLAYLCLSSLDIVFLSWSGTNLLMSSWLVWKI
jgi:hypothetical protein